MSSITKLEINKDLMSTAETVKNLTVKGSIGAKFTLIALQDGTLKYYNFEDDLFELGHAPKQNLRITMSSRTWRGSLKFPSGGGKFVVKLLTELGTEVKGGSTVISHDLEKQAAEATVTLTPATVNTANYQTFPTTASTGSVSDSSKEDSQWTINNASTDAGGFGLKVKEFGPLIVGEGLIKYYQFSELWYIQETKAIVNNLMGDGLDSTKITVASVSGLSVGMTLHYHKTTVTPRSAGGEVYPDRSVAIEYIDSVENVVAFSREVAFEDGETMTLRANGPKAINFYNGMKIDFSDAYVKLPKLQKTVRGNVSNSQTITLKDTHGISGGLTVKYAGLGVSNDASNRVNVVTPDCPDLTSSGALDNDGTITVESNQTLSEGTVLTFDNVHDKVLLVFTSKISKFPESSVNINLDLDQIFTVGVSGS